MEALSGLLGKIPAQSLDSSRAIELFMQPGSTVTVLHPAEGIAAANFAVYVHDIRARLAAAALKDKSWRVALDVVETERWPEQADSLVVGPLMMPGMVSTGAQMMASFVEVLSELEQCIRAHHAGPEAAAYDAKVRKASLSTAPAQLQRRMGLLVTLDRIFTQSRQQRQRQRQHQGEGKQPASSSCALGHGSDCPAAVAAGLPIPQDVAPGAGPPCRSCLLAHAELLAACSALLRYWPECVLAAEPVGGAWVGAAAECALDTLQDVSTSVLQHQQQLRADGKGDAQQQPGPPADVLQPGIAALELLAAVCAAAGSAQPPDLMRWYEQLQHCERGVLDLPCMLPSMLAVGAAAVLGQEMQQRLGRTAAARAGSGASSAAAGAVAGSADLKAPDAAPHKDQGGSSLHGGSSSKATGQAGARASAADAAWRLVCVTEQWAGGQLLPQPFALLLEALGCSPKAFLLLACIWQQQQQAQAGSSSQQQQPQGSSLQAAQGVLADVSRAYNIIFFAEHGYITCDSFPAYSEMLALRLPNCHNKNQDQLQHTQQHLLLALLLMRAALRGSVRGMFQPAPLQAAAASGSPPDPLGMHALQAAATTADCVSTWLCWVRFKQQQQQRGAQQQEPAAAGEAAGAPSQQASPDPWDLGGESSSAVLLELLQGHCLLLQEGARELQTVTCSWAAARSSGQHSGSDSGDGPVEPDEPLAREGEVFWVEARVARILQAVLGLLRVLVAAAAVDSGVLQQAAPHLFGLAGTLEQLVRLRCTCHCKGLVMSVDRTVLQLLQLLLGDLNLSAYGVVETTGGRPQQLSRAAAAARSGFRACGLLPRLAIAAPLGGKQQRQLLGLLFSCLKLFSTYPAGLYAFSWLQDHRHDWLVVACDTIRAACAAGRLLLVAADQGEGDRATGTPSCNQAGAGRSSGSAAQQQQCQDSTPPGGAGGSSSSCHSCGLGADGTAALLPWVVLQGRALQLWVSLFKAYVQLPPAAQGSKAAARGSKGQDIHLQPYSLVGSATALQLLVTAFQDAVSPSTQLLAVTLQGVAFERKYPGGPLVEKAQRWQLGLTRAGLAMSPAFGKAMVDGDLLYGVPWCQWLRPQREGATHAWLQQQLSKRGQQLRGHFREQGLDLSHLGAASGSAAPAALDVVQTVTASGESLRELGDGADAQHRLRQSDVRRYLKSWEVTDAAVLKGVLAMLSGGEHSAADVVVAAWLCSPSISGSLLTQLQEFSSQLSTLPIHEACNNPACRVTAGSSEQGLVAGKACVCGGCKAGHYCSRACQREHWPVHQRQCGAAAGKHKQ